MFIFYVCFVEKIEIFYIDTINIVVKIVQLHEYENR